MNDCMAALVVLWTRALRAHFISYSALSSKRLKLSDVPGKFRIANMHLGSGYVHTGEDRLSESKFYIPFQPQKWASNKSNSSVTSSCASCGFLRSRLESQSWNSFNPFPIVNKVSAGVPTPPDSGKTPQLKTSKLAQN